jgi:hypothetical protein
MKGTTVLAAPQQVRTASLLGIGPIGFIGCGRLGCALAFVLARAGLPVFLGSRDGGAKARTQAQRLDGLAQGGSYSDVIRACRGSLSPSMSQSTPSLFVLPVLHSYSAPPTPSTHAQKYTRKKQICTCVNL